MPSFLSAGCQSNLQKPGQCPILQLSRSADCGFFSDIRTAVSPVLQVLASLAAIASRSFVIAYLRLTGIIGKLPDYVYCFKRLNREVYTIAVL